MYLHYLLVHVLLVNILISKDFVNKELSNVILVFMLIMDNVHHVVLDVHIVEVQLIVFLVIHQLDQLVLL